MKNLKVGSILFLGIGGISMHQLALAFKSMGVKVLGYDAKKTEYTRICENNGIMVTNKFGRDFLDVDLCIKTGAITSGKYLDTMKKRGVEVVDRAVALSWLSKKFKCVIAVAGTHGKSTTASLIYEILRDAGKKVSCHIGADVLLPRFELGDDYLVVEACEYNKSFLSLRPDIAVVTNVEREHLDSYGSLFNLRSAFTTFTKRANIRYAYDEKSTEFLKKCGKVNFVKDVEVAVTPKIKGTHNMKNIALAIKVAHDLGISEAEIARSVNTFVGVPRRYEKIGEVGESKVFIDYAHHPTEIKAFVDTFTDEFKNALIVFQPHTYSRTKVLLKDFIKVLGEIKNLVIIKEYPAREKKTQGMSAYELYLKLKDENNNVIYAKNIRTIEKEIKNHSAIAFVGAGDINQLAHKIVARKVGI